ncbi:MAG: TetR/AcrR family transcriptional regulator [Solirubrobacteraceae bacterium]
MSATAATAATADTTLTTATPRPRGAARREALLEAALRIVAEVGADAVTHRRVAEVADLPLASTTYWFDSKEHLLTAAIELAAERDIARVRSVVNSAGPEPMDPIELVTSQILEPIDHERPGSRGSLIASYALLLEAARRPALQAVATRWSEAYVEALGAMLAAAGSCQPRADAQLLMATYDGLQFEQLATGVSTSLTSRLRRVARSLLETS